MSSASTKPVDAATAFFVFVQRNLEPPTATTSSMNDVLSLFERWKETTGISSSFVKLLHILIKLRLCSERNGIVTWFNRPIDENLSMWLKFNMLEELQNNNQLRSVSLEMLLQWKDIHFDMITGLRYSVLKRLENAIRVTNEQNAVELRSQNSKN